MKSIAITVMKQLTCVTNKSTQDNAHSKDVYDY